MKLLEGIFGKRITYDLESDAKEAESLLKNSGINCGLIEPIVAFKRLGYSFVIKTRIDEALRILESREL